MLLTVVQAEKALLAAEIRHTPWIVCVGYQTRIFMVNANFDCDSLPPEFELLWRDGKECVVAERIDTLKDFFKHLFPDRPN